MLKTIPGNISPQLMMALMEMGHGDKIVLADANFPAAANARRLVRADGIEIPDLLESLMKYFPLDNFVEYPVKLMAVAPGLGETPEIWDTYGAIIEKHDDSNAFTKFEYLERMIFYEEAKKAFAVVATGTTVKYANIMLQMGVV